MFGHAHPRLKKAARAFVMAPVAERTVRLLLAVAGLTVRFHYISVERVTLWPPERTAMGRRVSPDE